MVSTKTGEETPFFEALKNLGIETKEKELMEYASGLKKADWDVGIAVDAIKMLDMVDVVVLVSGDGDFIPLVEYMKNHGRIVEVSAFRETTSSRLIEAVDKYTNLSENKRRYLIVTQRKKETPNQSKHSTGRVKKASPVGLPVGQRPKGPRPRGRKKK